jgi:hypothetical protein
LDAQESKPRGATATGKQKWRDKERRGQLRQEHKVDFLSVSDCSDGFDYFDFSRWFTWSDCFGYLIGCLAFQSNRNPFHLGHPAGRARCKECADGALLESG